MKARAFTLIEVLVVIAILCLLAALLFPVFAQSKERAKLTRCQARLKQFALAFNMYRTDNNDHGFKWTHDSKTGNRYPFNYYEPMASYFTSGDIVWCPEPPVDPIVVYNFYHYRVWMEAVPKAPNNLTIFHPIVPEGNTVLGYCANHTDKFDPRPGYAPYMRAGRYLFVRADLSLGMAKNPQMETWLYDGKTWNPDPSHPTIPSSSILRFPGESWPPTFE